MLSGFRKGLYAVSIYGASLLAIEATSSLFSPKIESQTELEMAIRREAVVLEKSGKPLGEKEIHAYLDQNSKGIDTQVVNSQGVVFNISNPETDTSAG